MTQERMAFPLDDHFQQLKLLKAIDLNNEGRYKGENSISIKASVLLQKLTPENIHISIWVVCGREGLAWQVMIIGSFVVRK